MGRRGADVSDRILYVPTVSSEHGNRTEMELDLIAESASLRARLAETERERADCVRVSDVARALGVLEDIDTGRDIIEAAQSIKQDADRWSDEAIGLRARLAEAEAERDRADYGLKVTAEARDRHRIEADSYKEMLRCRGNTLDRLGAELDAAQSDLAQAREELAALREGDELECISAVNTHPTLVEQDKQVRLFVEWAKRCVEQANREGRYYLECVCRMSPRDKLSALPGGEAKVVAARVNPMNTWCSHCYHGDGHCDGGRPGCTCPCRHAAAEPAPNPPAAPSAALSKCMSGKCDECNRAAQSAHRADSGEDEVE
jgi:hypothetical protein